MRSALVHLLPTLLILCISIPSSSQRISSPSPLLSNNYDRDLSIGIPITSIGDPPSTIHLVAIKLGQPPQTLHLVPDTGSAATWVFCDDYSSPLRTFDRSRSSTFSPIHCSSPLCDATDECSSHWDLCPYTHEYADGTSTTGYWATDTVTVQYSHVGLDLKLNDLMIGCSDRESSNFTDADGILGLSPNSPSFTGQVADKFGMRFSYGLANGDLLAFGKPKRSDFNRGEMQYVRLVDANPQFFFVEVSSLSFDNAKELDIPKSVWDFDARNQSGGVILDTGTTMTYVPEAAFRAIQAYYVEFFFRGSNNVKVTNSEICFASFALEFDGAKFPQLSIEFEGGARLVPMIENLYYKDQEGMSCLAIWPTDQSEGSIIGSSLQKGYFWEYDLLNQRVGFAPFSQQL